MIIEPKDQSSTICLQKSKEIEDDIDLDEEIVIPNWDIYRLNPNQKHTFGKLLQKKEKQKRLREEIDKEYKIIEDAINILTEATRIEVDSSQPILNQLEEAIQKFNEDTDGQDKLVEKTENKLSNKVLEHIAQQISIYQVALSKILVNLETSYTNVSSLFGKLCDVTEFTKEVKDKLSKIDIDLKASAQQLQLDPSSSSAHFKKIRFLIDMQAELLREEERILSTLNDI